MDKMEKKIEDLEEEFEALLMRVKDMELQMDCFKVDMDSAMKMQEELGLMIGFSVGEKVHVWLTNMIMGDITCLGEIKKSKMDFTL